ncbi:hypothetical protein EBI01_16075 [Marinomonas rhizomae]|nr:hypothetical protein EBI01_16075 [Marinomonas rhizomae]
MNHKTIAKISFHKNYNKRVIKIKIFLLHDTAFFKIELISENHYLSLNPYSEPITKKKQLTLMLIKNKILVNLINFERQEAYYLIYHLK